MWRKVLDIKLEKSGIKLISVQLMILGCKLVCTQVCKTFSRIVPAIPSLGVSYRIIY